MKSITIHDLEKQFTEAYHFIEEMFNHEKINKVVHEETMLVFEALYHKLQEELREKETEVTVALKERLGDLKVIITYEGNMYDPMGRGDEFSPETKILQAYNEKIDHSYRYGRNFISITIRQSFQKAQMTYIIASILAILAYSFICLFTDTAVQADLQEDIVFPIEKVFANSMLMIAAPVTFFSLLKNRTNAYFQAEWSINVRRLHSISYLTSVIAVLLGIMASMMVDFFINGGNDMLKEYSHLSFKGSIWEGISNLIPSSIIEPFESLSPFPLIILSSMVTHALFSSGKHFDLIKQLVDAMYEVCARILSIVMASLPFFLFMAVLDVLLRYGFVVLLYLMALFLIVMVSLLLLILFYALRLKLSGIRPVGFAKKLVGLLRVNYTINSSIDAVPHNIRWCAHNLNMDRKKLWESMPIMAQINLDGNCFLITLTVLIYIFCSGSSASALDIAGIGVLVLFLSLGAPNQPGSCLLGILIIFFTFDTYALLPLAILTEALFGGLQNLINVTGDIITLAVDSARSKTDKAQEQL